MVSPHVVVKRSATLTVTITQTTASVDSAPLQVGYRYLYLIITNAGTENITFGTFTVRYIAGGSLQSNRTTSGRKSDTGYLYQYRRLHSWLYAMREVSVWVNDVMVPSAVRTLPRSASCVQRSYFGSCTLWCSSTGTGIKLRPGLYHLRSGDTKEVWGWFVYCGWKKGGCIE